LCVVIPVARRACHEDAHTLLQHSCPKFHAIRCARTPRVRAHGTAGDGQSRRTVRSFATSQHDGIGQGNMRIRCGALLLRITSQGRTSFLSISLLFRTRFISPPLSNRPLLCIQHSTTGRTDTSTKGTTAWSSCRLKSNMLTVLGMHRGFAWLAAVSAQLFGWAGRDAPLSSSLSALLCVTPSHVRYMCRAMCACQNEEKLRGRTSRESGH
jgi:hypothetical protein